MNEIAQCTNMLCQKSNSRMLSKNMSPHWKENNLLYLINFKSKFPNTTRDRLEGN